MQRITSDAGVADLATLILDPARKNPVCVVSSDAAGDWLIGGNEIVEIFGDLVGVYEIPNGPLTYLLAERLPSGSVVFGGAARLYPVDFGKNPSPELAPLFQFNSPRGATQKKSRIIDKLWMMAKDAGLLEQRSTTQQSTTATIKGFVGSELAMITLPNGGFGTIRQDLHFPDVPLDWIFGVGDQVEGVFDTSLKLFSPHSIASTKADLLAHFGNRAVTLGLVKSTTRAEAQIALMPTAVFTVPKDRISGNPMDVIDRYLDEGDVVRVRIYRDEQGRPAVRLDDLEDDEEPISSLSLLPNGRPWLEEGRYAPWREVEAVEEIAIPEDVRQEIEKVLESAYEESTEAERMLPAGPRPQPPGLQTAVAPKGVVEITPTRELRNQLSLQVLTNKQAKTRVEELERSLGITGQQLLQANAELLKLDQKLIAETKKNARLRDELSEIKTAERDNGRKRSTIRSRRSRFLSDAEWFDEEIRRAWIGRYSPQDRAETYPLDRNRYAYDVTFFESITPDRVDEGELGKLVRLTVDLVTGREMREPQHHSHPWLERLGGRQQQDSDGSLCWRAALEQRQPQAKRLKYFMTREGVVRLASVHPHDEGLA